MTALLSVPIYQKISLTSKVMEKKYCFIVCCHAILISSQLSLHGLVIKYHELHGFRLYSKMNHFASNSFQTLSFLQKSVTLSLNPFTIFCILKKTYFTRRMTMAKRKAVVSIQDCVACGCCIKVCPRNAISIPDGIYANIHQDLCVGCGKCAKECPASIITLEVME